MFTTLGLMYLEGKGVDTNEDQAKAYFEKANISFEKEQENEHKKKEAIKNLGLNYFYGRYLGGLESLVYDKAYKLLKKAEEEKLEDGLMFNTLGLMYLEGKGVEQHEQKAHFYFKKANQEFKKNKQNIEDRKNLGLNYFYGRGLENPNYCKAWGILDEVESKGLIDAQMFNALGEMYNTGQGVPSCDFENANEYFEKARKHGDKRAVKNLGLNYFYGRGLENPVYDDAYRLLQEAEKIGLEDDLMFNVLGHMYLEGKGVDKNEDQAKTYFEKANKCFNEYRKHNGEEAIKNLGLNDFYENGTKKDARELLESSKKELKDPQIFEISSKIYRENTDSVHQNIEREKSYAAEENILETRKKDDNLRNQRVSATDMHQYSLDNNSYTPYNNRTFYNRQVYYPYYTYNPPYNYSYIEQNPYDQYIVPNYQNIQGDRMNHPSIMMNHENNRMNHPSIMMNHENNRMNHPSIMMNHENNTKPPLPKKTISKRPLPENPTSQSKGRRTRSKKG